MKTFPGVPTANGVTRQVLADSPELMVVAFRFISGAQGAMHSHPHVQATYVEEGRFEFNINSDRFEFGPGDSFIIPAGSEHGCLCIAAGTLIDTFTPRRDDFL